MEKITSFSGEYAFLSNFYPAKIEFDDVVYPTSEHFFVAMKTLDLEDRKHIATIETPGQVKRYGRKLDLRKDWEHVKIRAMNIVVFMKFNQNPDLLEKLLSTGEAELIEGNDWGDTVWGVCNGVGENHLGKILMHTRWYYYVCSLPRWETEKKS